MTDTLTNGIYTIIKMTINGNVVCLKNTPNLVTIPLDISPQEEINATT